MRRWWYGPVLAAMILAATTGCLPPPRDGDGALTDSWAAFETPTPFLPQVGVCHPSSTSDIGHRDDYTPVDCGQPHDVETIFVGIFTGAHAVDDDAPAAGSAARHAAREVCDQRAEEFLGAPWQTGRIRLRVVVPSSPAWQGGARWYRCDVGEMTSMEDRSFVPRTSSLANALAGDAPLRWGCFTPESVAGGEVGDLVPVACSQPHQSEFAGVYAEQDLAYDEFAGNADQVHERCRRVVASYAGLPIDDDLRYRFGTIYDYPFKDEWDDGNQVVRCLLWRDDPALTGSARGGGTEFLPIRYE
ncbi:septum formation family protein [Solwaraspora sp. WMMB335]|uniref:septum formation family protein n=1 Tax=Solwaraspora sp. WMMB335 TaxID=3404118 RepID=UPI003B961F2E